MNKEKIKDAIEIILFMLFVLGCMAMGGGTFPY